jgi:hypothetical protein
VPPLGEARGLVTPHGAHPVEAAGVLPSTHLGEPVP